MMGSWENKVVVVVGVNFGNGRATAIFLAKKGAIVVGFEHEPSWTKDVDTITKEEFEEGLIMNVKLDLRDEKEIIGTFEWIEEHFGGLDMLINIASVMKLDDVKVKRVDIEKQKLNLICAGLCICSREATKSFKKQGLHGHIVNVGRDEICNFSNSSNCPVSRRKLNRPVIPSFFNKVFGVHHTSKRVFSQSVIYRKIAPFK